MRIPTFLYGSHATVTRACIRVAEALVVNGTTLDQMEGELLDTASTPGPVLLAPTSGAKGFLLYALLEALWSYHVEFMRDDEDAHERLIASFLKKEWSLACLFTQEGQRTLKRSKLEREFLRATDRSWNAFVEVGPRFDARDSLFLSDRVTTIQAALAWCGVPIADMPFRMPMATLHALVVRVVSGDVAKAGGQ